MFLLFDAHECSKGVRDGEGVDMMDAFHSERIDLLQLVDTSVGPIPMKCA